MAQTAYNLYTNDGRPGLLADSRECLIETALAGSAILFGVAVSLSNVDSQIAQRNNPIVAAASAVGSIVLGITLLDNLNETGRYEAKDPVNLLRRGACWMVVDAGATPANLVYGKEVYLAAGGKATDVSTTATVLGSCLSGVVAYNTTTNIVLVEVDFEAKKGV